MTEMFHHNPVFSLEERSSRHLLLLFGTHNVDQNTSPL